MSQVAQRLQHIRERMQAAAARAGRDPGDTELMAVSKIFSVRDIHEAVAAGQTLFGENRVQEALSKIPALPPHLRWHLIGPLQSNKVRKILPCVETIQSIDCLDIARKAQRIATELDLRMKVYLEVNIAGEDTKHGFTTG